MNQAKIPELLEKLGSYLENYSHRPGQLQMAQAVAQSISDHNNLAVEGGTGIGKSVAYLVPAILSIVEDGNRVLVATSHKPLQDQIAKHDLPRLARLFAEMGYKPFEASVLKGLNNYLCWHSIVNEQSRIMLDQTATRVVRHANTAGSNFTGDFEDLPFNVPAETRSLLSADSEDCLGKKCPQAERCYALAIRRKAEAADLVITNHSLLSLDISREGSVIPGEYSTYIIDEGHNFEDNATKANGLQTTLASARRFITSDVVRRATAISTGKLESARHYLELLQIEVGKLWTERSASSATLRYADYEDENRVLFKRELVNGHELADSIDDLAELIKHSKQKTIEDELRASRVVKQGAALAERFKRISLMTDPNLVYYAERNFYNANPQVEGNRFGRGAINANQTPYYSLYGMPIDVSGYLAKWFNDNNVIVTSATLSDGENFNFFMRRVGMSPKRTATLIVPSPFNYRDRIKLYLPRNGNTGGERSFFDNLAGQIAELLNAVEGRALVLFTSHMALEAVWKRLYGLTSELNPPRPLFKQGEAQMQRIIADFQATPDGVIFGTRSWWQGVNLPGMRMVIIDKLPFPQMNDPVIKARIDTIDGDGGNSFVNFTLPTAIITFRQGFGRLMRKESDRGVVVVCDERIVKQRYGSRFIKSLPTVGFLQNLNQVRDFVADDEQ